MSLEGFELVGPERLHLVEPRLKVDNRNMEADALALPGFTFGLEINYDDNLVIFDYNIAMEA